MIDRRPALIAHCASVADVQAAVNVAREHELLVAIRGGGHNVTGKAVCDDGLVIDLSRMNGVSVDPASRTARAEGGALWGQFDAATQAHGLATTGGTVSTTGIAGLTLGGGIGMLGRSFGLACDNLRSIELVTADGQALVASATEHPELFWALRGGGGNFGVATAFTFQLHPVGPTVMGGLLLHPFERAREGLEFYREFAPGAPEALNVIAGLLTGPDGSKLLAFIVCHAGPLDQAERDVEPLRAFGSPLADLLAPMPYTAVQQLFDPGFPAGRRNYWKSNFVDGISDGAIDTLIDYFERAPSPWTAVAFEHLGGAIPRAVGGETAFSQRNAPFNLLITTAWADPAEDELNMRWAREHWQAMQPYARSAAFVNYLAAEEQDRVKDAYGANYARLAALKAQYDPGNLFRVNQNIVPAAG
jgi:FAD/FMN-containing dehydrogenase